MKYALLFLCLLINACQSNADRYAYLAFQATVTDQQLTSTAFPISTITVDSSLTYVGSDIFMLYDIARCEIHLFAEADADGIVKRLYWFQYEGYLPSLFPRRYDYTNDPYRAEIDGKTFSESVNYYNIVDDRREWRTGSDIMHVFDLLAREGYTMDTDVMRVRLVHLNESRANELMIMYVEAMDSQGLNIAALGEAGKDGSLWREASDALRVRAQAGMQIQFNP